MIITFEIALAAQEELSREVGEAQKRLKGIVGNQKHSNGMVFDAVKQSDEFKKAKSDFDKRFHALRNFNGPFVKKYKKELRQHRSAAR